MADSNSDRSISRGQRIFTCGHSFHAWVGGFLVDMAEAAGISGHQQIGTSMIGGSRAIQHWDVPDDENEAKQALRTGNVDVLTLSCMTHPDEGIHNFAKLAVEHNPEVRVTLQELWLPEDNLPFDGANRVRSTLEEFNGAEETE